ncbi:MAG: GIY-YIG nuclease family protein [Candidatus Kerfeldbacteria bacterium]|nr:GIY-YIG nuclease family protein [Candidatus Kerfeldbacteria bacterium]
MAGYILKKGKNMYCVYIIKSQKTEEYYIGSTGCLDDKIKRHNSGRSKATQKGRPWSTILIEKYKTRAEALKREAQIKSYHGGKAFKKLIFSNLVPSGEIA